MAEQINQHPSNTKMHHSNFENLLQRSQFILEASELGTWEFNIQTGALFYNEAWANMVGYTLEELSPIDKSLWNRLLHPDDTKIASERFLDCVSGKSISYKAEVRLRHKLGHWIWILDKGKVVTYTQDGRAEWIMGSHQDITDRKNNELELKHYKDLLERTKEIAKIGSWELDLSNERVAWSSITKKIHEVDDGFVPVLQECIEFYPEGVHRDRLLDLIRQATQFGNNFDEEFLITTKLGNPKWVRAIGTPVFEDKVCTRIYGLFQDITAKNTLMRNLAIQEEQFRQTFDYAPNGIALVSPDGKWLKVNPSLCKMVGYSSEELLKLSFQDITHPDDLGEDLELLSEMLSGKRKSYRLEKRYFHKDGNIIWVVLSVSIIRNQLGSPLYFVSQITNITEQKGLEISLRESNQRMAAILEASTQVGIIETDHLGIIKMFNKGAENLLGFDRKKMIDKQSIEIFYEREELADKKSKTESEWGVSLAGFQLLSFQADRMGFEISESTYTRQNGSQIPVHATIATIPGKIDKTQRYLLIFFDVTAIRQAEKEINALLEVTQSQNKRLLNFTHIVSHNLRSHSGNIAMLLDLIRVDAPELTKNEYFPLLNEASENLISTISHLNEIVLINSQREELVQVPVKQYVDMAIGSLKGFILESNAMVSNELKTDTNVYALPAYLESIMINLLSNAIKYRSASRRLEISISQEVCKSFILVRVSDNGKGLDLKKDGDKVFGLYKTFHGNSDARGIGLFITKNQIEAMGGKISIESEPNQGTTFTLKLLHEKN